MKCGFILSVLFHLILFFLLFKTSNIKNIDESMELLVSLSISDTESTDQLQNISEEKVVEEKVVEEKVVEEKVVEEKVVEEKVIEKKVTEEKVTEEKVTRKSYINGVNQHPVYFQDDNVLVQKQSPFAALLKLIRDQTNYIYPDRSRRKGQEGVVILELTLDKNGLLESLKIIKKSRYRLINKAAIDLIHKVLPYDHKLGKPVTLEIPIRFELN